MQCTDRPISCGQSQNNSHYEGQQGGMQLLGNSTVHRNLKPTLCCTVGNSYAALISGGSPAGCFRGDESTCQDANPGWGFYIPFSAKTSDSFVRIIAENGDSCADGTLVGIIGSSVSCSVNPGNNKPVSVSITIANFAASTITAQNYYLSCKSPTTCSPPSFGATSTSSGCVLGGGSPNNPVTSCGGALPAVMPDDSVPGVVSQTWTFTINPARSAATGCDQCGSVVLVVQQSGIYRGQRNLGQCTEN